MRYYVKIIFVIILFAIGIITNIKITYANDIEKFAYKLFNHYRYDDKITKYLNSFFSFSNDNIMNSSLNAKIDSKNKLNKKKTSIKLKSKNNLTYNFKNGQSIQLNPTNISEKIIYNTTPFSYLEIRRDSVLYGINIDF